MYLAPLNYDRFFKKVFSDISIAKRFLEDFFDFNLNFLHQNKLIFAMQQNIVKNDKSRRYLNWFEFAEKTRNRANKREDFDIFMKDDVFAEIVRRLDKSDLAPEDMQYIEDYERIAEQFKLHERSIHKEAYVEGRSEGWAAGLEEGKAEGKAEGIIEMIINMHKEGFSNVQIAKVSGKSEQEVAKIVGSHKN
jgi:flagellar biosynthesis/type III secretory pathway protein FliH